ncbi:MAG: NAD(P)H-dependent flavin oxidoreductase, partial [Alphaproteobacteria bacterium]
MIGGGYGDPDWVAREIEAAGNARVGIGFITWRLKDRRESFEFALSRGPACVMLSFDDPGPYIPAIHQAGAAAICQVQSVAGARQAAELGADIIVAQGAEAGGHGSSRATMALVPAIVDAVAPVPVAAAGGIADGRGLAAALMLGAAGVLVGSRFVASNESLAHDKIKAGAVAASGDATYRGSVFDVARGIDWPEPWTIRTLKNSYIEKWEGREADLRALGEEERARFMEAAKAGDTATFPAIVGEAADLIRATLPAGEIVAAMVGDAEALLDGGWAG